MEFLQGDTSLNERFRTWLMLTPALTVIVLLFVGGLVFVNKLTWLVGKLNFLNSAVLWLEKALTGGK